MIEASCHCGAVHFTVASPPETVTDCNCSMCRRYGGLWAYYSPADVTFPEPVGPTDTYIQGDKTLATHRCANCGCVTHWASLDTTYDRMGVNARMMDPQVLAKARVRRLDGADTWTYLGEGS